MKYLSVCSGIEAATQAWHPLGWEPVAFSEIEKFPSAVLAHHYPNVPNWGDMTKFKEWPDAKIDVLVGGTPCQSFSVAGLRKGLDDPRGNLMLTYLAIADKYKPEWIVWENVPGVLSSNAGKDFGTFLGALEQLGYGFAYRVLDAQYVRTDGHPHAVPQRRRRVFVVGCLGNWGRAAAVLFDSESLRGNPPPSRKAGQEVAKCFTSSPSASRSPNEDANLIAFDTYNQTDTGLVSHTLCSRGDSPGGNAHLVPAVITFDRQSSGEYGTAPVASTMARRDYKSPSDLIAQPIVFDEAQITSKTNRSRVEAGMPSGTLNKSGFMTIALAGNTIGRAPENGGNGTGFDDTGSSYTLTKTDVHAVAYSFDSLSSNSMKSANPNSGCNEVEVAKCLDTSRGLDPACNQGGMAIATSTLTSNGDAHSGFRDEHGLVTSQMQVRRLTPTECERLQAFPDGYTNIPGASDSARYKALGNSMAVNVMQAIGNRIIYVKANS